tara:strand:+ start:1018 stop:1296 length:279 start_codon:yes stop_codon:yes gene_type:complete
MRLEILNEYYICLDTSDNEIKKHTNYVEMIIHLFQLHTENPKADYFVKFYKDQRTKSKYVNGEYHVEEIDRGTYELDILGDCQIKEEITENA